MKNIPHTASKVPNFFQPAILLWAAQLAKPLHLAHSTVEEIGKATGMSRSRMYELKETLECFLSSYKANKGPESPINAERVLEKAAITFAVLQFIKAHPGSILSRLERQYYSDAFRQKAIELREHYAHLSLEDVAQAMDVPVGTLKPWMNSEVTSTPLPDAAQDSNTHDTSPVQGQIKTIIDEWTQWKGTLNGFCQHVQENCRISMGKTWITTILKERGLWQPKRRRGRSPDEHALKHSFQTFFPGAQWEGDGKAVTVTVGEKHFTFNLELMTDSKTSAAVGLSIRNEEDHLAVTEAFQSGVKTTGHAPLALLLDNKPANHTEEVKLTLSEHDTMIIRSTPGRPQNKPHVEGSFGLFEQAIPPLVIKNTSPKSIAMMVMTLICLTWARTLNHKQQRRYNNSSRFERYQDEKPSAEEIKHARMALEEIQRRQQLAAETRKARQDPITKKMLDQAFQRLNLDDTNGNIRQAIAAYPLSDIVNGIAIFEGKKNSDHLPLSAGGRYLLGIIRNVSEKNEGLCITEALIKERLNAQDMMLAPLKSSLEEIKSHNLEPKDRFFKCIFNAINSEQKFDKIFWLISSVEMIQQGNYNHSIKELLKSASNRIHATFAIPYSERLWMVQFLANKLILLS